MAGSPNGLWAEIAHSGYRRTRMRLVGWQQLTGTAHLNAPIRSSPATRPDRWRSIAHGSLRHAMTCFVVLAPGDRNDRSLPARAARRVVCRPHRRCWTAATAERRERHGSAWVHSALVAGGHGGAPAAPQAASGHPEARRQYGYPSAHPALRPPVLRLSAHHHGERRRRDRQRQHHNPRAGHLDRLRGATAPHGRASGPAVRLRQLQRHHDLQWRPLRRCNHVVHRRG